MESVTVGTVIVTCISAVVEDPVIVPGTVMDLVAVAGYIGYAENPSPAVVDGVHHFQSSRYLLQLREVGVTAVAVRRNHSHFIKLQQLNQTY